MGILNIPNTFTLLRLVLTPINITLHIALGPVWKIICIVLLGFSFLTDALDGFFARLLGQETRFGQIFDPVTDFVAINSYNIYMIFALEGLFSPQTVLILRLIIIGIVIRYIFVAITVGRTEKASSGDARAIMIGKCSSALQMFVLFLFMSITALNEPWWRELLSRLFLVFFSLGVLLALVSAIMYYLKYLEVKTIARTAS